MWNSYHPLVHLANTRTGEDGELEECVVISIDTCKRTEDSVMYGVVYRLSHSGDWYRGVPYERMCFKDPATPMSRNVRMQKVLNTSCEYVLS